MPKKTPKTPLQNTSRKNLKALPAVKRAGKAGASRQELVTLPVNLSGSLAWWIEQYFKFEVTTATSSQTVQRRDLALFLSYEESYVEEESGGDQIAAWTPRLSRSFQDRLRKEIDIKEGAGKRVFLGFRALHRVESVFSFNGTIRILSNFVVDSVTAGYAGNLSTLASNPPRLEEKHLILLDIGEKVGLFPVIWSIYG